MNNTNEFQIAARADFPDGVLWGNPASSAPLDILATWADAYGYDFSQMSDIASRTAAVRGILAEKRLLIVIDYAYIFSFIVIKPELYLL